MADGVAITAGSGTTVGTDDCAGIHFQKMKLYDGTADATGAIVVGAGAEANALRVAHITVATATLSNLASSTTSAQVVASTAGRRGLLLYNDDVNPCLVKYGTTASATSYTVSIPGGGYWEMPTYPCFTGKIDAIWTVDGAGSLRITELT